MILDLKDQQVYDDFYKKEMDKSVLQLIEKEKPIKIFTHSGEDIHPDHVAVNKLTLEILERTTHKPEVYIYSIWNPVSIKTTFPTLYTDIRIYFRKKMNALNLFKSQKIHITYPVALLIFHNILDGIKIKTLFAEKFFRIR